MADQALDGQALDDQALDDQALDDQALDDQALANRSLRSSSHRLAVSTAALVTLLVAALVGFTTPVSGAGGFETLPALAGGVDGPAHVSELIGDQLWVGGSFSSARNHEFGLPDHPTRNLAVIDINTGQVRTDRAFDLPASGSFTIDFSHGDTITGGAVFALDSDGETVWAGGSFESAEGLARTNLAAYDARTGDLLADFAPTVNGRVIDILHVDDALYIAGTFNRYNGATVGGVIRVDPTTGARDQGFSPNSANGEDVWTLDHHSGVLYLGGTQGAESVDAVTGTSINDYDNGGIVADLAVSSDGTRLAIAHENNEVYVYDVASRQEVWSNRSQGPILSVAWGTDVLFVGATYHWDNNQDRIKLVALDAATGQRDSMEFTPQMNSFWAGRSVLVTPQGLIATGDFSKIAVGPNFEQQEGINARRVAIFRPQGAWQPAPSLVVAGDMTCDGVVDTADIQAILDYIAGGSENEACPVGTGDMNGDSETSLLDALLLARSLR